MEKRYKSNTHACLSVSLRGGGNARVSFMPLSGGGSVYSTDDEGVQWGLEHHCKYGKLFTLDGAEKKAAAVESPAVVEKVVKLSDWDTAKDYVSENFGVSRTKLHTRKQIVAAAKARGVVFDIAD